MYKAPNGDIWQSAGDWVISCVLMDVARARCKNNPDQFKKSDNIYTNLYNHKYGSKVNSR